MLESVIRNLMIEPRAERSIERNYMLFTTLQHLIPAPRK